MTTMADKRADLAGPGVSTYAEVAKVLPSGYRSILTPRQTMHALYEAKRYIEDGLARELGSRRHLGSRGVDRRRGQLA